MSAIRDNKARSYLWRLEVSGIALADFRSVSGLGGVDRASIEYTDEKGWKTKLPGRRERKQLTLRGLLTPGVHPQLLNLCQTSARFDMALIAYADDAAQTPVQTISELDCWISSYSGINSLDRESDSLADWEVTIETSEHN